MNTLNPTNVHPAVGREALDDFTSIPRNTNWQVLYKVAGIAALTTVLLIPAQLIVFIVWPPPLEGTVMDWFHLMNDNWLIGLLDLDLLLIVDYILLIPIVLGFLVVLQSNNPACITLATALFLVAIASYFASNTSLQMLDLSRQYEVASAAERAVLLAVGQAMLATFEGTAFHVSYVLGSVAGILIGVAMLGSHHFSRLAAYAVILGNIIGLGLYVPGIGIFLSVISVPVLWIWYLLIGLRFLQLSRVSGSEKINLGE